MKLALQLFRMQEWFGGDIWGTIEQVKRAEEIGVHQVEAADHLLRVTERIRLSSSIVVSPIRPVPLFAKELATLDQISRGRVDIGVGVGWQREECEVSQIPWEKRLSRKTDQIRACKALWTQSPATHHGEFYSFDNIYSMPFPVQKCGIPVWFGFALRGANLDRIAELGDGWLPAENRPEVLAGEIAQIKAAMVEKGRDPSNFQIRTALTPPFEGATIHDALKRIPEYEEAGVTVLSIQVRNFCKGGDEIDDLLRTAVEAAG